MMAGYGEMIRTGSGTTEDAAEAGQEVEEVVTEGQQIVIGEERSLTRKKNQVMKSECI